MTQLRHFTKPHHVGKISTDGFIDFETTATSVKELRKEDKRINEFYGTNFKRTRAECQLQILANKHARQTTGTWVWFTEEKFCATANNGNTDSSELYFEFDSADICAKRWIDVKSTFKGKAAYFAEVLDSAAREMGDNPNKYWVCKKRVPIALAKQSGVFATQALWDIHVQIVEMRRELAKAA
jgi:hypothetical protein